MKILLGIASLMLTACTRSWAPTVGTHNARPGAPTLAIRAVTVVDVVDGSLHPEQTVLVAGNRIAAVGTTDEVRIPSDAELVEAAGRYLIPGLWDMHVHSVTGAGHVTDTSNPSIAPQDWHLPLFLAYGVTGIRNMNDRTGDVTLKLTNTIKRQLAEGSRRGPPRFLSAGPGVDGDPYLMSKKVVVRTAAEARAVVDQLASNGADFIKVYENVSREAYFAIIDEARRRHIPVDGHLPFRITPQEAATAGQRTIEHPEAFAAGCSTAADAERERFARVLAEYDGPAGSEKLLLMQIHHYTRAVRQPDPAACASTFEAYRHHGVAVTADLLVYHHIVHAEQILSDTARMRLVPATIRRNWEGLLDSETTREFQSILRPIPPSSCENVRLANEAESCCSRRRRRCPDGGPGPQFARRAGRLVEAGLTPLPLCRQPRAILRACWAWRTRSGGSSPASSPISWSSTPTPLGASATPRRSAPSSPMARLYRRADLDRLLAKVQTGESRHGSERSGTSVESSPEN